MSTRIKFVGRTDFRDAVLFTGLPGIGLVGKIAVDYILKQVKAEKVAEIHSDFFPPSVQTNNGLVELIKDEVFVFNFKGRDFLFLAGPVQPTLDSRSGSMGEHYEFSRAIFDSLKDKGLVEVCTLAGLNIGEKRMHSTPNVIAAATDKKNSEQWKELGAVTDKQIGLISGTAGLLLGLAKEAGMQGVCLMGETNARLIYGDPGASKKLLELLKKAYGFDFELTKMEKEAKEIEKAFAELNKQLDENDEDDSLSYVR